MKTKSIIAVVLMGVFFSCEDNLREISFVKYSLIDTSCQWTNLGYDNSAIVINNNEDLKKHVNCTNEEDYPSIDFSKHTLLLVSGISHQGIRNLDLRLEQYSKREYRLNAEILLYSTDVMEPWAMALLTEKLDKNSKVNVNVNIIENY